MAFPHLFSEKEGCARSDSLLAALLKLSLLDRPGRRPDIPLDSPAVSSASRSTPFLFFILLFLWSSSPTPSFSLGKQAALGKASRSRRVSVAVGSATHFRRGARGVCRPRPRGFAAAFRHPGACARA
eukprot:622009-Pleurochrysis_carterae.AAC.3